MTPDPPDRSGELHHVERETPGFQGGGPGPPSWSVKTRVGSRLQTPRVGRGGDGSRGRPPHPPRPPLCREGTRTAVEESESDDEGKNPFQLTTGRRAGAPQSGRTFPPSFGHLGVGKRAPRRRSSPTPSSSVGPSVGGCRGWRVETRLLRDLLPVPMRLPPGPIPRGQVPCDDRVGVGSSPLDGTLGDRESCGGRWSVESRPGVVLGF